MTPQEREALLAEALCETTCRETQPAAIPNASLDHRHRVAARYRHHANALELAVHSAFARILDAARAEALEEAAAEVARQPLPDPSCEADIGYYDGHMAATNLLHDRADRLRRSEP